LPVVEERRQRHPARQRQRTHQALDAVVDVELLVLLVDEDAIERGPRGERLLVVVREAHLDGAHAAAALEQLAVDPLELRLREVPRLLRLVQRRMDRAERLVTRRDGARSASARVRSAPSPDRHGDLPRARSPPRTLPPRRYDDTRLTADD